MSMKKIDNSKYLTYDYYETDFVVELEITTEHSMNVYKAWLYHKGCNLKICLGSCPRDGYELDDIIAFVDGLVEKFGIPMYRAKYEACKELDGDLIISEDGPEFVLNNNNEQKGNNKPS